MFKYKINLTDKNKKIFSYITIFVLLIVFIFLFSSNNIKSHNYDLKSKNFNENNIVLANVIEGLIENNKERYASKVAEDLDILNSLGVNKPAVRSLENLKDKKLIAFTFDDGPSIYTDKLLDNLDKYNARVTFFVVGNRIDKYKDTLLREYKLGHQIGNHTYNHPNLIKLSNEDILNEIQNTNSVIKSVINDDINIIRPPYGNIDDNVKSLTNLYTILWDLDTLDWKTRNSDSVYEEIISKAHDGAIVLLHDLYETSIDGALHAMDTLQNEGYAFVTIDEMIRIKNINLDKDISYSSFE